VNFIAFPRLSASETLGRNIHRYVGGRQSCWKSPDLIRFSPIGAEIDEIPQFPQSRNVASIPLPEKKAIVPGTPGRVRRCWRVPTKDPGENETERGSHAMWISLFAFASGAAVCLSVAAIMMQPASRRTLRS
jgi:hypothetical protein